VQKPREFFSLLKIIEMQQAQDGPDNIAEPDGEEIEQMVEQVKNATRASARQSLLESIRRAVSSTLNKPVCRFHLVSGNPNQRRCVPFVCLLLHSLLFN
jgi:hypothetical protein